LIIKFIFIEKIKNYFKMQIFININIIEIIFNNYISIKKQKYIFFNSNQ
jgi:hypothetical protein